MEWFRSNLDIVFFIYGLAFLVMGIAILAQPKKGSGFKIADILWLLALFGITHGINEHLDMWAIIKGRNPSLDLVRWFVLIISYFFLFEFGRRVFRLVTASMSSGCPLVYGRMARLLVWWLLPVIGIFILVIGFMSEDFWKAGSIWTRYLLGFPGGVLIGLGFLTYYRCEKETLEPLKVKRYFLVGGISFLIYGILGGLVVPSGDFFPSSLLNTGSFLSIVKIPVQALRMICAIVAAWAVGGMLKIFNREARNKFQEIQADLEQQIKENLRLIKNLSALYEALRDILSEIKLETLLKKIVDNAREIVGAKYAVVSILNEKGEYEYFIPSGIKQDVYNELKERYGLPSEKGLLGYFLKEGKPIRLSDISRHPASIGVPEGHPQVKTFLGIPILLHGKIIGRLYFAEKLGGKEFTVEDEDLALLFAATAAIAIDRASLMEEIEHLATFPQKNPYPVLECDTDCNITYLNPAAQRLINELGMKEKELLPPDISEIVAGLKSLNKDGAYHELRVDNRVFGEYIHLMPDKETVRVYTVEITEAKKTEDALLKKEKNLLNQQKALLKLSKHENIRKGELKAALKEITETSSNFLNVERVNVWLFDEKHTKIQCLDSYEKSKNIHTEGEELLVEDYPAYFKALEVGRVIAAHDAHTDPRTREFSGSYLSPHNITAMLDAPVRLGGEVVGVICHEHVGEDSRIWTAEEQAFAASIADLVSLAIEAYERRRAEERLRLREHQQAVMAGLGQRALSGIELIELMNNCVTAVARTLEVEYCKVLELLPERNVLLLRAGVGWKNGLVGHATVGTGADSQAGYTLLCNEPVVVEDLRTETRFSGSSLLRDHGIVSGMSVIIRGKERPFGVMGAHTTRHRAFTEEDINFLQAVANILAEAINRKQTEEELLRHTMDLLALADSFNVISAVPLTENLYEVICNVATRNFDIKMAWIGLISKGNYEVKPVAQSGFDNGYLSSVKITWDDSPYGMGPTGMAIKTKSPRAMNDIDTDPTYKPWRQEALKRGYRSSLAVPLIDSNAEVMGVINFYSTKPRFFTKKKIHLFQVFANYASVAIENRLLIEELEERVRERTEKLEEYGFKLRKLYELSFTTKANAKEFAKMILQEVTRMLDVGGAAVGSVSGDEWVAYAVVDHKGFGIKEGMRLPLKKLYCGIIYDTKKPLVIHNAIESEEFRRHPDFLKHRIVSYLGVPIFIGEKFFGILCTFCSSPHYYTEYDLILHQLLSKRLEFEFIKEKYENELKEAMMQAQAANKAKSDFLLNMSHELRTPLNAIIGFSEMMIEGHAGRINKRQKEYLNDILESGKHLLSLISDILDLSKIEAGKIELELREINLGKLLEGSIAMFREKAIKHRIKTALEIDEKIGNIVADERKIKQIMFNLLGNAFKFTPDGGKVTVTARLEGDYIEVSVEDTGIGIAKEDIPKLFQPFQQLESPLTKKYEGTGLGLSLCKKFVELHGGKIWVESQIGRGSKFIFTIPANRRVRKKA